MNNYKKLTFNNIMDTINVLYNPNNCLARLKNNLKQQCSHKNKPNSLFCGVHMKCSNVYRIDLPEHHQIKLTWVLIINLILEH